MFDAGDLHEINVDEDGLPTIYALFIKEQFYTLSKSNVSKIIIDENTHIKTIMYILRTLVLIIEQYRNCIYNLYENIYCSIFDGDILMNKKQELLEVGDETIKEFFDLDNEIISNLNRFKSRYPKVHQSITQWYSKYYPNFSIKN